MTGPSRRLVRLGSVHYIDPDGRARWADEGAEVLVHPDHVERFDRLNVLADVSAPTDAVDVVPADQPAEDAVPADPPKRRGRARKDDGGDAVRDGD